MSVLNVSHEVFYIIPHESSVMHMQVYMLLFAVLHLVTSHVYCLNASNNLHHFVTLWCKMFTFYYMILNLNT